MEPKYDNYLSYTPYNYCLQNALKLNDPTGAGPQITITGDKIDIKFQIYYTTFEFDSNYGLDATQITYLNQMKGSIETGWSGNYDIDGNNFKVTTTVELILENAPMGAVSTKAQKNDFYMIAANDYNNQIQQQHPNNNIGYGTDGNTFIFSRGNNLQAPYSDTGAHEAGHAMGLNDITVGGRRGQPTLMEAARILKKIL